MLPQKASRIQYFISEGWGNEISVSLWTLKGYHLVTQRQLATALVSQHIYQKSLKSVFPLIAHIT